MLCYILIVYTYVSKRHVSCLAPSHVQQTIEVNWVLIWGLSSVESTLNYRIRVTPEQIDQLSHQLWILRSSRIYTPSDYLLFQH